MIYSLVKYCLTWIRKTTENCVLVVQEVLMSPLKGITIRRSFPSDHKAYRLTVNGLTGGHSGMDIHIRAEEMQINYSTGYLFSAAQQFDIRIHEIDGGGLRNAIPREAFATVVVSDDYEDAFKQYIHYKQQILHDEYKTTDPALKISIIPSASPDTIFTKDFQASLLRAIYACPNGIYRMSPDIPDLGANVQQPGASSSVRRIIYDSMLDT